MVFRLCSFQGSNPRLPAVTTEYTLFRKGDDGGGDTPLPIPNREVKPARADGTAGPPRGRVGRRPFFCSSFATWRWLLSTLKFSFDLGNNVSHRRIRLFLEGGIRLRDSNGLS